MNFGAARNPDPSGSARWPRPTPRIAAARRRRCPSAPFSTSTRASKSGSVSACTGATAPRPCPRTHRGARGRSGRRSYAPRCRGRPAGRGQPPGGSRRARSARFRDSPHSGHHCRAPPWPPSRRPRHHPSIASPGRCSSDRRPTVSQRSRLCPTPSNPPSKTPESASRPRRPARGIGPTAPECRRRASHRWSTRRCSHGGGRPQRPGASEHGERRRRRRPSTARGSGPSRSRKADLSRRRRRPQGLPRRAPIRRQRHRTP
mmetsp:Transcript_62201/g.180374  ORF Transcript_62201/g.180374 Transcript_62201/m.180374 type:complete len:260 (+) Transcript_62201:552-1331(+)